MRCLLYCSLRFIVLCLLKDLGTKELSGEVWLVFHIIRIGNVVFCCWWEELLTVNTPLFSFELLESWQFFVHL